MSTKVTLKDRERALEEEFFRKKEQEMLAKLREQKAREQSVEDLRGLSGISDEAVLRHLVDAGVDAQTFMALSLVPLVTVAWADGAMREGQRKAVLRAARETGLGEGSHAYATLEGMLHEKPSPRLFQAWAEYIAALFADSTDIERQKAADDIVGRARQVARSAGGFLGVGEVSDAEKRVLARIAEAFER
jgi:hypothetical protein